MERLTTTQSSGGSFVLGWQLPKGDQGPRLSRRVRDLIEDPQAMGNYITYRDAILHLHSHAKRARVLGHNATKLYGLAPPGGAAL